MEILLVNTSFQILCLVQFADHKQKHELAVPQWRALNFPPTFH
ncbi:hypothetical protein MtrunA17_Chr3g0116391 [Medicago truncatula]|uniref:Uncharacterized protein n=1 Tax=Medicago truncatula TaxID=3880 RepID=A0A396IVK8_MEDTR|nr:hypothetical protein MtrunA17_Chr3g0116391 [Medicago truncatula]